VNMRGMRTGSWLKIKKLKTCDHDAGIHAVLYQGKTFGALLLGVYIRTNPFT
jgi:ATP-dependent DNA ligase